MARKKRITRAKSHTKPRPKTLLLPMNEANLEKLRIVLFNIHSKLRAIQDVMIVVADGLGASSLEHNTEYGRVLNEHASNPLFGELVELRFTIRQLGGLDLFAHVYEDNDPDELDEDERNSTDRSFT